MFGVWLPRLLRRRIWYDGQCCPDVSEERGRTCERIGTRGSLSKDAVKLPGFEASVAFLPVVGSATSRSGCSKAKLS